MATLKFTELESVQLEINQGAPTQKTFSVEVGNLGPNARIEIDYEEKSITIFEE